MHLSRLTVIAALLCAAMSLNAANWGRWRGSNNTGVAPGNPPVNWSGSENIKWSADIPGMGNSTPVVWGDRVFLTTAVPIEASSGGNSNAVPEMTAEMRERALEITEGKPLSELGQGELRNVMKQLRNEARRGQARGRNRRRGGVQAPPDVGVEHNFVVMALDRATGATIWSQTAATATPHESHHRRYGSYASNSPVTDGETLYASFGSRGIFAYDLDGNLKWSKDYDVKLQIANEFGEGISPTIHGDTLLLVFDHQGDSFISALDKRTGEERWRRPRDERSSWSQPLITEHGGTTQAIVAASRKIRSYDLETGDIIWECAGLGSNVIPAVMRANEVVYAMSGHRDPNLLAIALGGEGDITESDRILWTNQRGNSYTPSPVLEDGILYMVTDRGMLSALDAKTGEPHYQQQRLPNPYSLKASPIGAGGKLYIATEQGDVVVVKMGPTYEVLATNTIEDETFIGSPVVADSEIFLRGRSKLYAVSAAN